MITSKIKINQILGIKHFNSYTTPEVVFVKDITVHKNKDGKITKILANGSTFSIIDKDYINENNDIKTLVENDELPEYIEDRFADERPSYIGNTNMLIHFAEATLESEKANGALFLGDDTMGRKDCEAAWDNLAQQLKETDSKKYDKFISLFGKRGEGFSTFMIFDTSIGSLTNMNVCFNNTLLQVILDLEDINEHLVDNADDEMYANLSTILDTIAEKITKDITCDFHDTRD